MPTLVDSNVILDIVQNDPVWGAWSDAAVIRHQSERLFVNPIIYAELCAGAPTRFVVDAVLSRLRLEYAELPREALFLASKAFLQYRQRGGTKTAPLPDFFIGAHAAAAGFSLLTRDAARYQTYFPSVHLICPEK